MGVRDWMGHTWWKWALVIGALILVFSLYCCITRCCCCSRRGCCKCCKKSEEPLLTADFSQNSVQNHTMIDVRGRNENIEGKTWYKDEKTPVKLHETPVTSEPVEAVGQSVEPSAPRKSNSSDLEAPRAPSFNESNGVAPV